MQRSKRRLLVVAAAAAVIPQLGLYNAAHAANVTWDGGGADNNLGTAANWSTDALPAATDNVYFAGNVRTTPSAAAPAQYLALFFAAGAAPFNIAGAGPITLGSTTAGNYLNNDDVGVAQTVTAPINMIGGNVWATQGDLAFNGLFNVGNGASASGNTVSINGGSATNLTNVTFAGGLTGAAQLNIGVNSGGNPTFFGTTLVTGDGSAYTGNVFVNGGNLRITNANALGSAGRIETALTSGGTGLGTLGLDGSASGGFTLAKQVTTRARQGTTANEISIRNVAGNNTISNVLTGTGGTQFNYESAGGSLTIDTWNTTGSGGGRTLRLLGASAGQINNWTPAAGNVITVVKDGAGTWTLGPGMNSTDGAFGPITVNAGNLILAPGLGARVTGVAGATAAVRPDVTVNNGGTLTVQAANGTDGEVGNATTPGILTVKVGGTLDASTFSLYNLQVAQVLVGGGAIKAGTLGAFGDNAIHIGDSTASTAVGTLTLQGNLSLSHAFASSTGGLYFNLGNTTTPGSGVNDLLSIQGDLQIDPSGGPIDVRLTPLATGLTTGTYRLIDYTSGTTLDPSNFNLLGFTPGTTRQSASITTAPGQVNLSVVGNPANLVWKGDGSANVWDAATTANFLNGATADKFFPFDNATFDDTSANKTVSLSGSLVLGSATVNTSSTYTFTGSGSLDGGGTLTKSGTGTLIVANTGPNTYTGGTTINAGTLQIGTGGTDGSLGTGAIVDNGSLVIDKSADVTLGVVSGAGSLTQMGTGNLILNAANTYTGPTSVQAGTVQASNAAAFGDAAAGTTVSPGATIYFLAPASTYNEPFTVSGDGPTAGTGALRAGGAVVTTLAAPVTFTGPTTLNADGGATLNITGPLTGTGGDLTKVGPGTVTVAGPGSAWTGNTNVTAGTLELGSATTSLDLPAGTVAVASGATLAFGNGLPASFTGTVTGAGVILQDSAGGTTTLTGNLTGFTGTLSTGNFGTPSTLTVAVPTGATTARVWDSNNNGASNQNGVGLGILRLTNSNALAPGAAIDIQVAQSTGTGRLELGNGVTINAGAISVAQRANNSASIESTDGVNTLSGTMTVSTGGNSANVQVDAGSTFNVQGVIQPLGSAGTARNLFLQGAGAGNVAAVIQDNVRQINVAKSGPGTWTLTGANTYTGTTTVGGGKLVLGPSAYNPVLNAPGYAVITSGRLVFDYTGSSSPAATVVPLVNASAASSFTTGQFRTTTDATHTLGYYDDGVSALTVMFTYYGDLNLDGRVNADDYALLDRGFAKHLTGWVHGDVNYDGQVNESDYLLADTAFGQQNGVLSPSFLAMRQAEFGDAYVAQLVAAVPEPSTVGLVALAALPLAGRRRRHHSITK